MKKESNINITQSVSFKDLDLIKLFKKEIKSIEFYLELYFDTFSSDKKEYTLLSIWYLESLYGVSYRIMDDKISVKYIDGLTDKVIEIKENISKEDLTKIIVNDIKENHGKI